MVKGVGAEMCSARADAHLAIVGTPLTGRPREQRHARVGFVLKCFMRHFVLPAVGESPLLETEPAGEKTKDMLVARVQGNDRFDATPGSCLLDILKKEIVAPLHKSPTLAGIGCCIHRCRAVR